MTLDQAKEQWLYWRLLVVKMLLYSLVQMGVAFQTATANVRVEALSKWERLALGIGVFVVWGGTMLALLDQTMSRLAKGQLPGGGDTNPPFKPEKG